MSIKRIPHFILFFSLSIILSFRNSAIAQITLPKIPDKYNPGKKSLYKNGWIDLNKNGVKDTYEDSKANIEDRIEDLLSKMTMNEKTCQMVTLYGYKRVLRDELPTTEWKSKIWKDGVGAIDEHLNGFQQWGAPPSNNPYVWPASRHSWALNEVQRFFIEETRLGIPVDFTNEGIRGIESFKATNFPTQLGLGHTWNRDLIRKIGLITGKEARLLGYTNVYAPILDVGRDQRWGRYEEIYGESPFLVAELGIQMVKGLQNNFQVAATAKHFVAYSNNKGAREGLSRVDPQMSPREVEMVHVYPFKRVIKEAGLLGVMSSYNDYDGFPIQGSYYWLTERLRKEMGFKGYVVSDSEAVEYLYSKHNTAHDLKEAVRQSVEAGLNVRCTFRSPDSFVLPLRELIEEASISEETINDRVRDILRVKFLTGIFDNPYQMELKKADQEIESEQSKAIALQASQESIVLLKNEKNTLPLNLNSIKRIAVIGPNANEKGFALMHYGPLGVDVVSLLEGIKTKTANKVEVEYTKGCELVDDNWPESEIIPTKLNENELKEIKLAVENAKKSDVVIIALGGGERTCGENKSRSSLDLPGRQLDLLQAVYETGKPIVLVLINGRPLSVNWADKNIPAIVEAWYPGSMGGTALSDVIFGDYNPGGKLTVTFPKSVGQIPFNFPYKPASQVDGGKSMGLKGNMTRVNGALYSFGHGLSYTTFKYSNLKLSAKQITDKQNISVSFDLSNTGSRAGDEVVQLYLRDLISSVTTYEKNLVGFERIHLKPGETKSINIQLRNDDFKLLNKDNKWVIEPGDFKIMIGSSSENIHLEDIFTVIRNDQTSLLKNNSSKLNEHISSSPVSPTAKNVADGNRNTSWKGKSGDYLNFSIPNNKEINNLTIEWGQLKPNTKFEIQLSSGGGQFINVYSGQFLRANDMANYSFKSNTASDIRIQITSGEVEIKEVKY
jgi:beta-glucosidase